VDSAPIGDIPQSGMLILHINILSHSFERQVTVVGIYRDYDIRVFLGQRVWWCRGAD
jgi:hypothetical protein